MNRKYITLALVGILAIVSLSFFWTYWTNGWIEVTAPAQTPNNSEVTVVITPQDKSATTVKLKPGKTKKVRSAPGIVQIDGSAETIKSVDIVTVERRKTTKLTTPVGQQYSVQQLGTNARFCPVALTDKLYSYNCQADGPVVRHTATSNSTIFGGQSFALLEPLQTGLLGFHPSNFAVLQFLNLQDESVQAVSLPANVQQILLDEIPQIITSGDLDDGRFVLVFPTANKIFLFKNLSDGNPIDIQLGEGVVLNQEERAASFSLHPGGLLVYAGVDSHTHDNEPQAEEHADEEKLPAYLFEYLDTGELTKTMKLADGFDADSMHKLADNYYLAERFSDFEFYFYNQTSLDLVYSLGDVSGWDTLKEKTYIQSANTLYLFTPTGNGMFGIQSVFSSPDISISGVFNSVRGLIFTAFAGTSSSAPLNIYHLLETLAQPGEKIPGAAADTTVVLFGFEELLTLGVSSEQVEGLKTAFNNYAQSASLSPSVNMLNIQPVPHDRFSSGTVNTINFDATVDGKSLKAKLEYSSLVAIRLYLYNPGDGSLVYDSQLIRN